MNSMKANMRGTPKTAWTVAENKIRYPKLEESLETDVCVIGAGITGILTAHALAKNGLQVVIIDKDEVGGNATRRTTAFLTASIDIDYADLIKSFGPVKAREIVESHSKAIDYIEAVAKEEKIECDFKRCSNFAYAIDKKDLSSLDEEHDAALELGLHATLEKDGSRLGFPNFGYLEIKDQAKFHPTKFVEALAENISKRGARIFENTKCDQVSAEKAGSRVHANGHSIKAKWVISAVYEPLHEPLLLYFKKGMYKTYVIEAYVAETRIPEGTFEDTKNPYRYMRVDPEGSGYRIIIGGEDHRNDIPANETKNYNALEEYLEKIVPKESFTIRRRWTGPILEPIDGLAFIGHLDEDDHVLYAFGFSGNGMTYAAISAQIISDLVAGKPNPWYDIYRTNRLPYLRAFIAKGRDFTEELVRGVIKNAISQSRKPNAKFFE